MLAYHPLFYYSVMQSIAPSPPAEPSDYPAHYAHPYTSALPSPTAAGPPDLSPSYHTSTAAVTQLSVCRTLDDPIVFSETPSEITVTGLY